MSRTKGFKITEDHKRKLSLSNKGKHVISEETRRKMREAQLRNPNRYWLGRKGPNHSTWKGGITPINKLIRASIEYKLWRTAIFIRDNRKCIWCGSKKDIEADHIKPFAFYPELRFAIDNGRTLCHECHVKTETYNNHKKI